MELRSRAYMSAIGAVKARIDKGVARSLAPQFFQIGKVKVITLFKPFHKRSVRKYGDPGAVFGIHRRNHAMVGRNQLGHGLNHGPAHQRQIKRRAHNTSDLR